MYKIIRKKELVENIYLMDIEAKRVAKSALPGQFVIVKVDEWGERIPLTICDYDREKGTVSIVFQTLGASTKKLQRLMKETRSGILLDLLVILPRWSPMRKNTLKRRESFLSQVE